MCEVIKQICHYHPYCIGKSRYQLGSCQYLVKDFNHCIPIAPHFALKSEGLKKMMLMITKEDFSV